MKGHRKRNLDAVKAGKAYGNLRKRLRYSDSSKEDLHDIVLYSVKSYLEDRLRIGHKVHTFNDVNEHLRANGAGEDILTGLKSLFTKCEQGRYAGESTKGNKKLPSDALNLAKLIEKILK